MDYNAPTIGRLGLKFESPAVKGAIPALPLHTQPADFSESKEKQGVAISFA